MRFNLPFFCGFCIVSHAFEALWGNPFRTQGYTFSLPIPARYRGHVPDSSSTLCSLSLVLEVEDLVHLLCVGIPGSHHHALVSIDWLYAKARFQCLPSMH